MDRRPSIPDSSGAAPTTVITIFEKLGALTTTLQELLNARYSRVVDFEIKGEITNLQVQLRDLDDLGKTVRKFLLSPVGKLPYISDVLSVNIDDPSTLNVLFEMSKALEDARIALETEVKFPEYLTDVKRIATAYPVFGSEDNPSNILIQRLRTDTNQAKAVHAQCHEAFLRFKEEWSSVSIAASATLTQDQQTMYINPVLIVTEAWDTSKFRMEPKFPRELSSHWLNPPPYEAEMEKRGKAYFEEIFKKIADGGDGNNLIGILETVLRDKFNQITFPERPAQLAEFNLPDRVWRRYEELKQAFSTLGTLRDAPIRLCVFGAVNQGKSTMINALIGRRLLYASSEFFENVACRTNGTHRWPSHCMAHYHSTCQGQSTNPDHQATV